MATIMTNYKKKQLGFWIPTRTRNCYLENKTNIITFKKQNGWKTGKIKIIGDTTTYDSGFKKRQVVITSDEQ
jgi:hypothetical protein